MSNTTQKTKDLVMTAMFVALIIAMTFIPNIGFINLVFTKATTIHIPVIVGAILLGPKAGLILGFAFGVCSVINNTIYPSLTSFVFSPFVGGNVLSLVVAIIPRMAIALVAYYVYKAINKTGKQTLALAVAGFAGSMTNTILVMSGIYLFFGESYAAAKGLGFEALFGVIMGVVGVNGVPEAIVASILTAALCKVLFKVKNGR